MLYQFHKNTQPCSQTFLTLTFNCLQYAKTGGRKPGVSYHVMYVIMNSHVNWSDLAFTKVRQVATEAQERNQARGYNSEGLLNDMHELPTVIT